MWMHVELNQVSLEEQPGLVTVEPSISITFIHTKVFVVEGTSADTHGKDNKRPRQSVEEIVIDDMDQGGDRKCSRLITFICGAFRFLF